MGKQDEALNKIDLSTATIEDFNGIVGGIDGIIKGIGASLDKAKGLNKVIDGNKQAVQALAKKYKEKKDLYNQA